MAKWWVRTRRIIAATSASITTAVQAFKEDIIVRAG